MRLIDADALPRHGQRGGLVHWKDIENAPTIDIEERLNDAYAHGWSDAEAKYHDAVEVVRCRDCKYKYLDGSVWNCPFGLMMGGENFFCSYGSKGGDSDEID